MGVLAGNHHKMVHHLLLLLLLSVTSAVYGCIDYNGVERAERESWDCEDGCNICTCLNGQVLQTLELCDVDGCIDHNEVKRADGESWECEDGWNIENWYNLCVETHLIDGTSDFKECNGFCI